MPTNIELQDDLGNEPKKDRNAAIIQKCPTDAMQLSPHEKEMVVDNLNKIQDLMRVCLDSALFACSQRQGKVNGEEKFITPLKNVIEITKSLKTFLINEAKPSDS